MSKHTPGPWNCMRASAAGREIITSEVSPVDVCVLSHFNKSAAEIDANARLIAAAPDLLEALENLLCLYKMGKPNHFGDNLQPVIDAKAAIAKATGEQE